MADSVDELDPLGRWSPTLWLVSGAVGIVYAALYGMEALVGTYPAIRAFLGPVMNVLAFTALLGLYPVFADRRPWLARSGGVFAVLAIAGSFVTIGATAGIIPEGAAWVAASQLVSIVFGMTIAFLAFGVASVRSEVYSRTVGLLLLVPVVIMVLNIGIVVAGYASPEGRLLVSGLWAVTYLGIGVTLRAEHGSSGPSKTAPGTTTR